MLSYNITYQTPQFQKKKEIIFKKKKKIEPKHIHVQ